MPMFYILLFLGAIVLWFLLSFCFIPLGKKVWQILHTTKETLKKDEEDIYIRDEDGNITIFNNTTKQKGDNE